MMPVIRLTASGSQKSMPDCFYPDFLNIHLRLLQPGEEQAAAAWINTNVFDAALQRPCRGINVTEAVRQFIPNHPDWSDTPLEALYACVANSKNAVEIASWIYGNLVCRIGVRQRRETWWVWKQTVGPNPPSSSYILAR